MSFYTYAREREVNKELIIAARTEKIQIALTEDKQLVELHTENLSSQYTVGDIYVGKVKKLMAGLNAAFVELGDEKDGFMHYLDLGPNYLSVSKYLRQAVNGDQSMRTLQNFKIEPILEKKGNMNGTLRTGQLVIVQVSKEPISTKGPNLTGDISLAGHFLVLTPFQNNISISAKIKNGEEKNRLKRLMQSIKPANFGVIVRTNAQGKSVQELDTDLRDLMGKWAQMTEKLKRINGPQKVLSELGATTSAIRELLTDDLSAIYVDEEQVCNDIKQYIKTIAPEKESIVRHYKMATPIFDQFGISRDIRRAFGKIVTIRSGVYLYIEHTEAMHVIDVNSGNHIKSGTGQEDTALQVNIESAKEIARQLRLRDMGGIVIVDFVDMAKGEHRNKLLEVMREEMKKDKARHTILPLSKFGLMQITRQRVRPALEVNVQEKCPLCNGEGTIKQSIVVVDDIESDIRHFIEEHPKVRKVHLTAHSYIAAYLAKGVFSRRMKWQLKYKRLIAIHPQETMPLLEYRVGESVAPEQIQAAVETIPTETKQSQQKSEKKQQVDS